MKVPLIRPYIDQEEEKLVIEVLRSGWVTQGNKTREFEDAVAEYTGAPFCVAVNSCASALHLAMIIAGVGPNHEVICPSYTFIATPNCIEYVGAKPIFADVAAETSNIDPGQIERLITARTKALLPVHQNGMACDLERIKDIADKYGLMVIEDAAYGIGVTYGGRRIGGFSPITCFSFHPRKAITTGEGGILSTSNDLFARRARSLRAHGASISVEEREKSKDIVYEKYEEVGYNYKMTELQAAVGIAQLKKLDWIIEQREKIARRYFDGLSDCEKLALPLIPDGHNHTFGSFQLVLRDGSARERDELVRHMGESGISCRRGIPACHREPFYLNKYGKINLPNTEQLSDCAFFIPMFPQLSNDSQDFVIEHLRKKIKRS